MTTPTLSQADKTHISKIIVDMENSQIHDEKELLWLELITIINNNIKTAYEKGGGS